MTTPPRTRKRLPRAERRDQIIAAAQKVFVRCGLNGTRTRELAKEAGINEATLFSHFASKDDLFDAAVLGPLKEVVLRQQEISREFAEADDPAAMRRLSRAANEQMLTIMTETFPLLVAALFSDREKGAAFYREHLYPVLQSSAQAARTGLVTKVARFDPELIALAAFGVYFALVMDHSFRKTPVDVEHTAAAVSELLMSGFLEPEG